jgi:ATP-dependent RNA helicase DDX31/DBP7
VHDLSSRQPRLSRSQGSHAIVICPTRELCQQVADVLTLLVRRFVWLVSVPGLLQGVGGC